MAYYAYIFFDWVLAVKENTAAKKIRSGRGASISMALFILLICAVVGSVVLGAATASAGRLSNLAESDRRYYSVSSAAELIVKALDGEEVVISGERTTETTTVVTYIINADGSVEETSSITNPPVSAVSEVLIKQFGADTLLSMATRKLVFGANAPEDRFWLPDYNPGSGATGGDIINNLVLSHKKEEETLADLQVNIEAKITTDGRLHLILKSPDSAEAVYTVELFFTPAYNTEIGTSSDTQTIVDNSTPPTVKETTTITEVVTKTTTVYWNLSEMKKGQ